MTRCPEIPAQVIPLLSEDEEPLVQESGAALLVGYSRQTNRAFAHTTGACRSACEPQSPLLDFGNVNSGSNVPIIVGGGDSML
jgi:hypothetical protein